jgi:hypothetical protein
LCVASKLASSSTLPLLPVANTIVVMENTFYILS